MERCFQHRKDLVGDCIWCGKRLCQLCIARKEGRKLYCDACAERLGPMRRTIPRVEAPPTQQAAPQKRKPYLDKDGFVDFTGR